MYSYSAGIYVKDGDADGAAKSSPPTIDLSTIARYLGEGTGADARSGPVARDALHRPEVRG